MLTACNSEVSHWCSSTAGATQNTQPSPIHTTCTYTWQTSYEWCCCVVQFRDCDPKRGSRTTTLALCHKSDERIACVCISQHVQQRTECQRLDLDSRVSRRHLAVLSGAASELGWRCFARRCLDAFLAEIRWSELKQQQQAVHRDCITCCAHQPCCTRSYVR